MISFKHQGNFNNTEKFLKRVGTLDYMGVLEKYGRQGVAALASATPQDSGETAQSWNYEIKKTRGNVNISWTNSHENQGVPIAILIQYGHGTSNGGYVQGRDYINPALQPIFDKMSEDLWREVTQI